MSGERYERDPPHGVHLAPALGGDTYPSEGKWGRVNLKIALTPSLIESLNQKWNSAPIALRFEVNSHK